MDKIPTLDTILIAAATYLLGSYLGPILGTLLLIVFGWFLGVIVGLWRLPDESRIKPLWFVVVTFGGTVGSASLAATWIGHRLNSNPSEWLFFVAIVLPAVGHNWIDAGVWAWGLARRVLEQRVDAKARDSGRAGE